MGATHTASSAAGGRKRANFYRHSRGGRRGVRVKGRRKDKGVAILDYALGNRPSTGEGEVGGRLCPQRARRQLVPVIEGVRSRAAEAGVARSGSHLPGRALQ